MSEWMQVMSGRVDMYELFQSESQRVGKNFDLFYHDNHAPKTGENFGYLQYTLKGIGTVTVNFTRNETDDEEFYFKPAGLFGIRSSGFGTLYAGTGLERIKDFDEARDWHIYDKKLFENMPEKFKDLFDAYMDIDNRYRMPGLLKNFAELERR